MLQIILLCARVKSIHIMWSKNIYVLGLNDMSRSDICVENKARLFNFMC